MKPPLVKPELSKVETLPPVDLDAVSFPASLVAEEISLAIGRPVVLVGVPSEAKVNLSGSFADGRVALDAFSRVLGGGWAMSDGLVTVGPAVGEVDVVRRGRFTLDELKQLGQLLGVTSFTVVGDAVLIRGNRQAAESLSRVIRAERVPLVVDVMLVRDSDDIRRVLLADLEVNAGSRVRLDAGTGASAVVQPFAEALFSARGSSSELAALSVYSSTFAVLSGVLAKAEVGDVIRVRRRVVNDAGVVVDSGFDEIRTGLLIELEVSAVADDVYALILRPTFSAVAGSGELPATSTVSFALSTVVPANQWSMVGRVELGTLSDRLGSIFGADKSVTASSLLVLARAYPSVEVLP